MRNFLYLQSIPLALLISFIFFIFIEDKTDFEVKKETTLDEYCESKDDYIDCIFSNNSALRYFEESALREPYPDNDHAKDDKGGCDRVFLESFQFKDKSVDALNREKHLKSCNPYTYIGYLLSKGTSKDFLSNDYNDTLAVTLYNTLELENSDENLTEEKLELFKEFIREPYTLSSDGSKNTSLLTSTDGEFFYRPEYLWDGYEFSYWIVVLGLSPLIAFTFLYFKFYQRQKPIFGKNTFEWIKSKRKFRISILICLLWLSLWLAIAAALDGMDELYFYLFGLYPILSILSSYFIITAED